MTPIYLDHAASKPLLPLVYKAMEPYLLAAGNPSAIHHHGRYMRSAIEEARRKIATHLGAATGEIFFTSGGTEANNWASHLALHALRVRYVITSPLEHPSVLKPLSFLEQQGHMQCKYVDLDAQGRLHIASLKSLLERHAQDTVLVSLMHANNEIGAMIDLDEVGDICAHYGATFHTDTVQTIGACSLSLKDSPLHMAVGSAHKFYGPKGIGFLYIRQGCATATLMHGGTQERQLRAGTENVASIVGMAEALAYVCTHQKAHETHILRLKHRMMQGLQARIPQVRFNGAASTKSASGDSKHLHSILSISIPAPEMQDVLVMGLDIAGISASAGSACASGAATPSYVLKKLGMGDKEAYLRFSFSHLNTEEEIDKAVEALCELLKDTPMVVRKAASA